MLTDYDFHYLMRISIAALLSGLIGFDRQRGNKPAGLRTHMLVGLGAALFVVLGELLPGYFSAETFQDDEMQYDPIRILEAVVGGVAFLGAGTIFFARGENVVKGLTTAASLWASAAMSMAVALGHYVLAVGTTLLIVFILNGVRLLEDHGDWNNDS